MIALDTNVLVRLLVNDPNEQTQIESAKSILIYINQCERCLFNSNCTS